NIITKTPEKIAEEGNQVTLRGGNFGTRVSSLIHGARISDNMQYKVTLGWDQWNHFKNEFSGQRSNKTGNGVGRGTITLDYQASEDSRWSFSTGLADGSGNTLSYAGDADRRGDSGFAKVNWDFHGFRLQSFHNWTRQDVDCVLFNFREDDLMTRSFDFSIERTDEITGNLLTGTMVTYGVSARHNSVKTEYLLSNDETQMLYAGFIQAETPLRDDLTMTLGCRVDNRPEGVGSNYSPRLGMVYQPHENHILWGAYSHAFQNPSFMQNFANINVSSSTVVQTPFGPMVVPILGQFVGSKNVDPQELTSYEVGYRNTSFEKLHFSMNTFFNRRTNLHVYTGGIDTSGIPFTARYDVMNQGHAKSWGGETELNFLFTDWMSGYANYTFQSVHGDSKSISPKNKANGGLLFDLGQGLKSNLNCNYVGGTRFDFSGTDLLPSRKTDHYFMVNGALDYEIPDSDCTVSLALFNLLHDVHVELPSGENIGTLATLSLNYRF
ncbi:MAG: TonB-dependent receptor, partial [Planctomycetes bacterium]|nr:TonB-dependent receptor [Planctomycetota bacterium]